MPELPEVEAIAARARRHCRDQRILGVEVLRGKYLENQDPLVVGLRIKEVHRRGKYVLFEMHDSNGWIVCHNAMSGYWDYEDEPWTFDYVEGKRVARSSDVRVKLFLENGRVLQFHDSRLFGRLKHMAGPPTGIGPEALATPRLLPDSPVMEKEPFVEEVTRCHGEIKPTLMNQALMAGVGNIYATEACGWTGIRPDRPAMKLRAEEAGLLFETVQELLRNNVPEIRYHWLRFYRKKTCSECNTRIEKIEQEGRSTWFCPHCQR